LVWISAGTLAILTEVFCGIPQSLQASAGIVSQLGHNCFFQNHRSSCLSLSNTI
jgi:hypothetical protein